MYLFENRKMKPVEIILRRSDRSEGKWRWG
jgi:hypothetical protein